MAKDFSKTSFKAYGGGSGKDSKKNDLVVKAFGENLTEDVLEKWIKESDISNDGKVNYHDFLRKMSQNKKKQTENFLYAEVEQDIKAEFGNLDKDGTGFLWASDMKNGILKTLDKKFQELLQEASVEEENVETTCNKNLDLEAAGGKNISSQSSENSEIEVPLPSPPDGGWGWVIVFACFMCNLVINGFRFGGFAILLEPLRQEFNAPISSLAFAGSISCGLLSILGPLIGGLINKFGLRPVCIAGSIVSCIGLCLSTLSPDLPTLILTMGVIAGVGYGMINLPAKVAIGYYFESKRALATGIAETGSGFGTFVFATLLTYLATSYGIPMNETLTENETQEEANPEFSEETKIENLQQSWKAPVFFIAGLCFCCILFGGLMRPLEFVRESEEEKKSSFSKSLKKKLGSALVPVTPKRLMSKRKPVIATPFSKKCLFYGGDVQKLIMSNNDKGFPAWNGCKNILIFNPKTDCDDCPEQGNAGFWVVQKPKAKKSILPILTVLKEMVNVELFVNAKFVLFGLSVFVSTLGLYVPYAYLPALAIDCIGKENLTMSSATFLLSIIGISNIVGKLVTGWLSDFRWVSTQTLSNVLILICGIDVLFMPLFHHLHIGDYYTFVFGAVVFGFCSSYVILKTIILVELLGLEKLTSAFGLLGLFEGVACLIGTPIAGAVYDSTERYDEPFYMAGGFFILASVLGFIVQVIDKRQKR